MKKTIKYYLITAFIISLIIFTVCGILISQEKGRHAVFGEEAETIQYNIEEIGTELKKILDGTL